MSMRSGLFDSTEVVETVGGLPRGNKAESADFFASYFASFVGNGVHFSPATCFQVLSSSGLTVQIRPGRCFINGYYGFDSEVEFKTFVADTSAHTYWLVLRLDITNGIISKTWITDPSEGALPVRYNSIYDLVVAKIPVGANVTAITDAMITDCRDNTSYCGYIKSLIDGTGTIVSFADKAGSISVSALAEQLPAASGKMTEPFTLLAAPTDNKHAVNKEYVDDKAGKFTELVRFTSSGTFNPINYPSIGNVYYIMIQGAGGGGGGGGGNSSGGGGAGGAGGGAGGCAWAMLILTSPNIITIIVGMGGQNGNSQTRGFDGGDTSITYKTLSVTAKGGGCGYAGAPWGQGNTGHVQLSGGIGGEVISVGITVMSGKGASAETFFGDTSNLGIAGGKGGVSYYTLATDGMDILGGTGGGSTAAGGPGQNGNNGDGGGGGGGGARDYMGGAGGKGGDGLVIVYGYR